MFQWSSLSFLFPEFRQRQSPTPTPTVGWWRCHWPRCGKARGAPHGRRAGPQRPRRLAAQRSRMHRALRGRVLVHWGPRAAGLCVHPPGGLSAPCTASRRLGGAERAEGMALCVWHCWETGVWGGGLMPTDEGSGRNPCVTHKLEVGRLRGGRDQRRDRKGHQGAPRGCAARTLPPPRLAQWAAPSPSSVQSASPGPVSRAGRFLHVRLGGPLGVSRPFPASFLPQVAVASVSQVAGGV